jgi:hypothetical protein
MSIMRKLGLLCRSTQYDREFESDSSLSHEQPARDTPEGSARRAKISNAEFRALDDVRSGLSFRR